jgi:hypothetical protein
VSTNLLVTALNSRQTRIGDPWKGSYHLSIQVEDREVAETLAEQMRAIGVEPRVNRKLDADGNPKRFFVAVYALESLETLLDSLRDVLEEPQREKLSTLVRARGPIHPGVVEHIHFLHDVAKRSDEAIAVELTRRRWVSGSRKGWTSKKVWLVREAYPSPYKARRASRSTKEHSGAA